MCECEVWRCAYVDVCIYVDVYRRVVGCEQCTVPPHPCTLVSSTHTCMHIQHTHTLVTPSTHTHTYKTHIPKLNDSHILPCRHLDTGSTISSGPQYEGGACGVAACLGYEVWELAEQLHCLGLGVYIYVWGVYL